MKARLTQRQDEALDFFRNYARQHGKPPTMVEIGRALGLRSVSAVHKIVGALEQKGYLRREQHVARGLSLADADDDPFGAGRVPTVALAGDATSGEPDGLRRHSPGGLVVDGRLLGGTANGACLALRVGDDGMNGDGMRKGDYVVVEEADWRGLGAGEVVAALVGEKTVVRRFELANGRLHLRPADRTYREETFAPGDAGCHVVGRVLAVLRKL